MNKCVLSVPCSIEIATSHSQWESRNISPKCELYLPENTTVQVALFHIVY